MSLELPEPVRRFFEAENQQDAAALTACFAPDGHVRDEGRDIQGPAAIGDWIRHAAFRFDVRAEPLDCRIEGAATVVTARITGAFPGSPVELTHRFRLLGNRIAALAIG